MDFLEYMRSDDQCCFSVNIYVVRTSSFPSDQAEVAKKVLTGLFQPDRVTYTHLFDESWPVSVDLFEVFFNDHKCDVKLAIRDALDFLTHTECPVSFCMSDGLFSIDSVLDDYSEKYIYGVSSLDTGSVIRGATGDWSNAYNCARMKLDALYPGRGE